MIVATYNIHHQEPRILSAGHGPSRWLVKVWVTDGEVKTERSIRSGRCRLAELLPVAADEIDEMLAENERYTDGGFTVVRLR